MSTTLSTNRILTAHLHFTFLPRLGTGADVNADAAADPSGGAGIGSAESMWIWIGIPDRVERAICSNLGIDKATGRTRRTVRVPSGRWSRLEGEQASSRAASKGCLEKSYLNIPRCISPNHCRPSEPNAGLHKSACNCVIVLCFISLMSRAVAIGCNGLIQGCKLL